MTRNRKADPAVLEREYVFDSATPPTSITALADKYGMARSGIAEKARLGRWYEKRKEFRERLGQKTIEALGDKWVAYETSVRERLMQVGLDYLDKYVKALAEDKITTNTRDMLGIAAMVRTLLNDTAANPRGEEALIDPESVTLDPDAYRAAIYEIKRLNQGQLDADDDESDESGPAERFAAASAEGTQ